MKKALSFLFAELLILSAAVIPAGAAGKNADTSIDVSLSNKSHDVSQTLYGIFIEDISYAVEGGLNSNLVSNNSFEYEHDKLYSWMLECTKENAFEISGGGMNLNNQNYLVIDTSPGDKLINIGFVEYLKYKSYTYDKKKAATADMGFKENEKYDFSAWFNAIDYSGTINVYLADTKGAAVSDTQSLTVSPDTLSIVWEKLSATLTSNETTDGMLVIEFCEKGKIGVDFAVLTPQNSHGYDNPNWKYASLRADLYNSLKDLSPAFIRFPGGCLAEGDSLENLFDWKATIGPLEERNQNYNLWQNLSEDTYLPYNNSWSVGYHEYFQLAEDLGAEPIPILNVGLVCQGRVNDPFQALEPGTPEWDLYVQDILDLIEYANGGESSEWGSIRAQNGHPEPFNLKYLGLGNENWGEIYFRNFEALKAAVNEAYPKITIISSSGAWHEGDDFDYAWETINEKFPDTIVDEHYYTRTDFLFENNDRYDSYDRNGAKVFLGEYAAAKKRGTLIAKTALYSALAEASYCTGLERNSDIVLMSCYAPTFAKHNAQHWNINMIWFDSQRVVLTPSYYAQMLNSNNLGKSLISTEFSEQKDMLYQVVTVDEDEQALYIKIVNAGRRSRDVEINLDGFGDVNAASVQYMTHKSKDACNTFKQVTVVPKEENLDISSSSFTYTADSYSMNIIRIAYGSNGGGSFYKLGEMPETHLFIPQYMKNIAYIGSGVIALAAVSLCVYMLIKKKKAR